MRPLDGITLVTLEHAIAAPFCTRQLAELGARVIQNEREWVAFCDQVLLQPALASDERFATNSRRTQSRDALRAVIRQAFAGLTADAVIEPLDGRRSPSPASTTCWPCGSTRNCWHGGVGRRCRRRQARCRHFCRWVSAWTIPTPPGWARYPHWVNTPIPSQPSWDGTLRTLNDCAMMERSDPRRPMIFGSLPECVARARTPIWGAALPSFPCTPC